MLFFLVVVGFWIIALFCDAMFKSCMLPPYVKLLNNGLSIKIGVIQVYTTRWNRCLQKWGCWRPRLQKKWFNCGVITTCILMPVALYFLILSVCNMIITVLNLNATLENSNQQDDLKFIQPVLPGVNIPLSDLPYYIITLLLCSVLHEIGHAIAATREDVKVQGFGIFFMGIFPGAFVDLSSDQMNFLSPWQQLRIFCAGVWHNVVMALVSYCLLCTIPVLGQPFYKQGNGVTVLSINPNSGLYGPTGLQNGDVVTSINFCTVKNIDSLKNCLLTLSKNSKNGFCVSLELTKETEPNLLRTDNDVQCCPPDSQTHICFIFQHSNKTNYACLPARKVLDHSSQSCKSLLECKQNKVCLFASLKENTSQLVPIERTGSKKVIFLGPTNEILSAASFSDYVSRYWILSTWIIDMCETFLKYIIAFSGALGILNIVPCFYLDGKFILKSLVDLTLSPYKVFSPYIRNLITLIFTSVGTLTLLTLIVFGILTLIKT